MTSTELSDDGPVRFETRRSLVF